MKGTGEGAGGQGRGDNARGLTHPHRGNSGASPDLQCSRAQHSRFFIFRHVPRGDALPLPLPLPLLVLLWVVKDVNICLAFMLLAEASKEGRMRGRTADHKADMALLLESDPKAPSIKTLKVTKSWESETGTVGRFGVEVSTARLRLLE